MHSEPEETGSSSVERVAARNLSLRVGSSCSAGECEQHGLGYND